MYVYICHVQWCHPAVVAVCIPLACVPIQYEYVQSGLKDLGQIRRTLSCEFPCPKIGHTSCDSVSDTAIYSNHCQKLNIRSQLPSYTHARPLARRAHLCLAFRCKRCPRDVCSASDCMVDVTSSSRDPWCIHWHSS